MQRLKAKRRRPVFTPFTSNPPAAAFLQNIITQSNLQKANCISGTILAPTAHGLFKKSCEKYHTKKIDEPSQKKTQNLF